MNQDLNDVLYFIKVVEEGGFSAAARSLNTPKSSVSRRISRLEERLGIRLLQRTTRRLSLTDAGTMMFERGSRILAELSETEDAVMHMQSEPRGLIRMTLPADMGPQIAPLAAEFLEQFSEVSIEMDMSNRYLDLVAEGYDLAVRAARALPESQLMARKLRTSRPVLVAAPDYLARYGEPKKPEDLSAHRCILFPRWSAKTQWTLQGEDGPVQVAVSGSISANNLAAVKELALAGLGVASLPEEFLLSELAAGRLVELMPGSTILSGTLWLVYPERRYITPKVRAWIEFLVNKFSDPDFIPIR
ncbi:MAG: LysR family transcriptional regulator [Acidobacteriota bacterium]|nr:LysR family transcriptional regulator [Acidobacteriota bacterium]